MRRYSHLYINCNNKVKNYKKNFIVVEDNDRFDTMEWFVTLKFDTTTKHMNFLKNFVDDKWNESDNPYCVIPGSHWSSINTDKVIHEIKLVDEAPKMVYTTGKYGQLVFSHYEVKIIITKRENQNLM